MDDVGTKNAFLLVPYAAAFEACDHEENTSLVTISLVILQHFDLK